MAISEGQFRYLRKQLEGLEGNAGDTARVLVRDRWCEIELIAEQYSSDLNPEPEEPMGNWGDAKEQWERVQSASKALQDALKKLGSLACAIRLDTARRIGGIYPHPCEKMEHFTVIKREKLNHKLIWKQSNYTGMWE